MPQDPEPPKTGTRKDFDPKEKLLKVRAKEYLVLYGIEYKAGNVMELPEREALGLIGAGQAEEIPEGKSAKEETGTAEQVAEATHEAGEPEHEDRKKAEQLEKQKQKPSEQAPRKRGS